MVHPLQAAIEMTLIISIFLMVSGIFRTIFAISERFNGWGWVVFNGAITFMLGLLIYRQWPLSGLWVIGLFIGIDLLLNGWAWVMLAVAIKNKPPAAAAT